MTYQKVKSSIVFKGAMNGFHEMFPLARMFPLAVMHTSFHGTITFSESSGLILCVVGRDFIFPALDYLGN